MCIKIIKKYNILVFRRKPVWWYADDIKMFSSVTVVGVIRTVKSHFFLYRLISIENFSAERKSWVNNCWDIFPYVKHNSSTIFITVKSKWWMKTFKNWPSGKLSCSLLSDTIKISIEPLICSPRISNLFLIEFTFRCPNINLLILLIQIFLRDSLTSDYKTVESSDALFSSLKLSLLDLKFQLPSIKFSKFFANRVLAFLFKCNFFIWSWFSFKSSFSINPIFSRLQIFLSLEFESARNFSRYLLSFWMIILEKDIAGNS